MATSDDREKYVPYTERKREDLVGGEMLPGAVADFLSHLHTFHMTEEGYKPTEEHLRTVQAGSEHIHWLADRLAIFERFFNTEGLTGKQISGLLSAFSTKDPLADWEGDTLGEPKKPSHPLLNLLPVYHPEHGLEPKPWIDGGHRRFVNIEWMDWKKKLSAGWNMSDRQAATEAARRTVSMLFPTPQSGKGIFMTVNDTPNPRQGSWPDEEVILPYEIIIERSIKERL